MKHMKVGLTFGLVIAVLIAAFFGSVYLANKAKHKEASNQNRQQSKTFVDDNKALGYKFEIPKELVGAMQKEENGYRSIYLIPYNTENTELTPIFIITATPKDLAKKFATLCAQERQTSPEQCLDFDKSDGENNLFYFHIQGNQSSELLTATDPKTLQADTQRFEQIMSALKNNISYYDVSQMPEFLTQTDKKSGYQYSYPAEFHNLGQESFSLTLPKALEKEDLVTMSFGGIQKIAPLKYCAPSGVCQNTTQNFGIDVTSINFTEERLLKSELAPNLTKVHVAGQRTYLYNEGAEGEGINYHFIISPNENQMLVVMHKYIDESVLKNYAFAKNFTSYTQQQKIVTDIIDSIGFHAPLESAAK